MSSNLAERTNKNKPLQHKCREGFYSSPHHSPHAKEVAHTGCGTLTFARQGIMPPPPRSMWSRKRGIAVCINGQCTPHALRMLSACLAHMPTASRWYPDGIHRVSRWYVSLFFMCRFQCRLCSSFVRFPLGSILVRYAQYRGVRIFLRFFIQERERRARLGSVACVHEGVTSTYA